MGIRRFGLYLCGLMWVLSNTSAAAAEKSQQNCLWRVESATNTVYLLGSIHVMPAEMYPLDPAIEAAFKAADVAVFEVNLDSLDQYSQGDLMNHALYPPGKSLQSELSAEAYHDLQQQMKALGMNLDIFQSFRPWFLAITLTMLELDRAGFNPDLGIDYHFHQKAKELRKKISALETVDFQFNLLTEFSNANQELFLRYTFADLKVLKTDLSRYIQFWENGQLDSLHTIVTSQLGDSPELMPIFDKIFFQRNKSMTTTIERFLADKQTYFVVVGVGHLGGEQGILRLLEAQGYRIEQM